MPTTFVLLFTHLTASMNLNGVLFFAIIFVLHEIMVNQLQNPVPKKSWTGLLNGKLERATGCAQVNVLVPNATFEGEEDCLYLNIFRPSVS